MSPSVSLKHVILGFLVDRPMHGYELKRALSPALPPARMLNDGVLYPLLRRMEREGLVRKKVERGASAPNRHVFHPTRRGREHFERWLRGAELEQDEVTYDFLVGHPFLAKCLFFGTLSAAEIERKLAAQLGSSTEKLRVFEGVRKGMSERGVDPFRIAILDLGIAQQKEKIRWLKRMAREGPGRRRDAARAGVANAVRPRAAGARRKSGERKVA